MLRDKSVAKLTTRDREYRANKTINPLKNMGLSGCFIFYLDAGLVRDDPQEDKTRLLCAASLSSFSRGRERANVPPREKSDPLDTSDQRKSRSSILRDLHRVFRYDR